MGHDSIFPSLKLAEASASFETMADAMAHHPQELSAKKKDCAYNSEIPSLR